MSTFNTSQANITYLSARTGLAPSVAAAWLANEGQSVPNPTNPLNIRTGNTPNQTGSIGGFGTYSSPQAGLDAAAWLLNANKAYKGILAAISGGTPVQQAKAIEASPWAAGHYAPGNISARVAGGSSTPAPSGGASTPLTSTPSTTNPGAFVPQPGFTQDGLPFSQTDANAILSFWDSKGLFNDLFGSSRTETQQILNSYVGQPKTAELAQTMQTKFNAEAVKAGNPLNFPDITGAVMFIGVVLVGVMFIGTGGLIAKKGAS